MSADLRHGPILPTLLRLAVPNVLSMLAAAAISVAETAYVGRLGLQPLAAIALVFPFAMLMQMISAGSMGAAISSAISRASGANDAERVAALPWHATLIGLGAGLAFTLLFLFFGRPLYALLGGRGEVLELACAYSNVVFGSITLVWLTNTLVSVLRGSGDMRTPALLIVGVAATQITLGAALGLGLGPFPRWGMVGVALGQVIAYAAACMFLLQHLRSGRSAVALRVRGIVVQRRLFADILRVGALASLSPLQSVLTILILTALVARVGVEALAGYGIGVRLEFLLIPIAFGVGVASVPLVGVAIGSGNVPRARRVAWAAGALSTALLGATGLVVTLAPQLWAHLYSDDPAVRESTALYLRSAGPSFGLFGLGLTLYFASQGAGRVLGPVLASTLRLLIVAGGGLWLIDSSRASAGAIFALIGIAMAIYGLATAASVYLSRWSAPSPR